MNTLTLFGLFAVTAMLVTYALERRSPWFIRRSLFPARSALRMGFCKARGPLEWSKPSGPSWPCATGIAPGITENSGRSGAAKIYALASSSEPGSYAQNGSVPSASPV